MMTLDERIENDLKQIYDNEIIPLKEIIAFVNRYKQFRLSEAEKLTKIFNSEDSEEAVSTRGLPGFFAGDRSERAKTVMVMLNPGRDVAQANNPITTYETLIKLGINTNSLDDFISSYKEGSRNYGEIDKDRADNFDLKQAAFLKPWKDCGIEFPEGFLDDYEKKLLGSKNKEDKEKLKNARTTAKRNVLMQKLQMDIVPYASRSFSINDANMEILFPFVETLFDEIFRFKRTYVIFCSNYFETIFTKYKKYKKDHPGNIDINIEIDSKDKQTKDLHDGEKSKPFTASCMPITIHYNNSSQRALIAHTFPNRALPNAFELMLKYGEFCYGVFKNSKI